jgi:hypothetical protein
LDLVLVGGGTPEQARAFRLLTGWPHAVLVDGDGKAAAAAGLRRMTLLSLANPKMLLAVLRARREGFRQGKTQGDPWRLGGTLVVAPGDRVLYEHRNARADDDTPLDDVIAAVRAAETTGTASPAVDRGASPRS